MTNETALTLAAAVIGSTYFLYCKLLKTAKLSLPNGLSVDRQAVEVKGQPGVWKSALMENEQEDVLTRFYPEVATIHDVFLKGKEMSSSRIYGSTESKGGPCVGTRSSGTSDYEFLSYDEVHEKAKKLSMTLVHEFGLTPGNTTNIGIYARNSPQWLISALACIEQSMVVVPLYDTLGAEAATFIVSQAEISVVIVDSYKKAECLVQNRHNMPSLKSVIVIDSAELLNGPTTIDSIRIESFDSALSLGAQYEYSNNLPKPEDNYIICYTSGTTGTPKGVMLTHSNIVANISGFLKILFAFQPSMIDTTQVHISYLPLSHMMEQLTHWTLLGFGSKIGYFRGSIQGLTDDIKSLKPTVFPVVPRLLNRLYDAITSKVQQQGFMAKLVYNFAFARKLSQVKAGKGGRDTIWDRLVFRKIQEQIGGKVDLMVTGSAPISSTVLETCRVTLGATIVEGYGQTECTALATFTWMGDPSTGHCGAPAPCALVKLGDVPDLNYFAKDGKGEIRIKGPCVTKGYYKDPERTAELFDEDGFLQTGDIGEMLPNGCIRIIDRKKHIFKLAQGEYVAPEKIEQVYIRTPVAQQVYVDGDSLERWLIAVVVPEPDVMMEWNEKQGAGQRSLEEICKDEKAKEFVLSELHAIGKANKLNSIEQVKKVILSTDPFTVENGLLTPTLKAKRPQLRLKYKDGMAKVYKQFPNL
ncbi:hypothetical protein GCK72_008743 [Caenorhabditis remanei]|uniref:Long-chain-fatty-acid--CoA ligase n=1 Tax=Caenorhabditis remanei TaxID=31234 RepID=A0A6A5H141_CAERE|nr:hypothetical protein GCK72_008743 [Caenorhabditis remanei]KAF1760494.1 hypothetical protein GCK72_008743 [Caenorhabditis remanei]